MTTNGGANTAAYEQAYNQIRQDIISGVLSEHERLTEQALAERIGLSRTPVRDAIAEGYRRYSLENYMFDPIAIAMYLLHEK